MDKLKFDIEGMTCSSCENHVFNAVKNIEGVENAKVNLLMNSLEITTENKDISRDIIKAIKSSGYKAKISKDSISIEDSNRDIINNYKYRLIISMIFWIPLLYISMGRMIGLPQFAFLNNMLTLISIEMSLSILIIIINFSYFKNGFIALFKLSPTMDSLVSLGASTSFIYSLFLFIKLIIDPTLDEHFYFESSGTILTLITLGKYLETISKNKTGNEIQKLLNLSPKTAIKIVDDKEEIVHIDEVNVGDIILVKPSSLIPTDGLIVKGYSSINEASITGESIPKDKGVGDEVISSTLNLNGSFYYKATKVKENTTINEIIKLVNEAASSKAPISKIADKVSKIFVPVVIFLSILTFIIQLIVSKNFDTSLSHAITILVISCPCALGLATPVAIMASTGKGASMNIIYKNAQILESTKDIKIVALDKTGTITSGNLVIKDIISFDNNEEELLKVLVSIESLSEHPIAKAITENFKDISKYPVESFESMPGIGLKATIDNNEYQITNKKVISDMELLNTIESLEKSGKTTIIILKNSLAFGIISLIDEVKSDSKKAINMLKQMGIKTYILTGDNKYSANYIKTIVEADEVISEIMPKDKGEIVDRLKKEGSLMMVGDGTNDAIALSKADVGVAIGSGTDVAIEQADIILIKNSLLDVVNAIKLSKRTLVNIKLSLFWAFIYNIIMIPIASGLFSFIGLEITPSLAALFMSLSSVSVVLNALTINFFKGEK